MASQKLFDPMKMFRLAPLITTTASLMYAIGEHMFLSTFLHRNHREQSNVILPSWFKQWFNSGVLVVAGLNTATIASTLSYLYNPGELKAERSTS
ncbi:MAG: hypothetical protein M1830_001401, partial [Pleopsidium flavum]